MHYRFPVILEEDETGGYVVECPSFQGCYTQGETYEEAMANIRELIRFHVARSGPESAREIRGLAVSTVDVEA